MITFLENVIHSHVSLVRSSVVQVVRGSMLSGTVEGSAETFTRSPMDCGYDCLRLFLCSYCIACVYSPSGQCELAQIAGS